MNMATSPGSGTGDCTSELLPELQSWKHRQLEEPEIIEQAPHMH
jgi:hypothetical protein